MDFFHAVTNNSLSKNPFKWILPVARSMRYKNMLGTVTPGLGIIIAPDSYSPHLATSRHRGSSTHIELSSFRIVVSFKDEFAILG